MTFSVHDNHGWRVTFHDVTFQQAREILTELENEHYYWDGYDERDILEFNDEYVKCIKVNDSENTIDFA